MTNTVAKLCPPWSSIPKHLHPSCRLVWSDKCYFRRNHTISTIQFLLHDSHHVVKRGSQVFNECWFSLLLLLNLASSSLPHRWLMIFIFDILAGLLIRLWWWHFTVQDIRFNNQLGYIIEFKWVKPSKESSFCWKNNDCVRAIR